MDDSGEAKNLEPKFVRGPSDREVQEGKLVRFEARVTGRPYPEVRDAIYIHRSPKLIIFCSWSICPFSS